ncbi:MAG: DUF4234 domain-containing protein [Bacilli bacterium]
MNSKHDYKKVNIPLNVLYCFLTLGIYYFIWNYKLSKNIKRLSNIIVFNPLELLCFIFIPYFKIYWFYTKFDRLVIGAKNVGVELVEKSFIAVIFSITGLSLINTILMQYDLNYIYSNIDKIDSNKISLLKTLSINMEFISTHNIALSLILSFVTFKISDIFWLNRIITNIDLFKRKWVKIISLILFWFLPFFNIFLLFKIQEKIWSLGKKGKDKINSKCEIILLLSVNRMNTICLALLQNDLFIIKHQTKKILNY